MPELPEVETVRRALAVPLAGRTVTGLTTAVSGLRRPLCRDMLCDTALGRRIIAVRRRAKYLVFELDSGASLVAHLGMSGSFRICPPGAVRRRHDHVFIDLDDGVQVRFEDPRRFGCLESCGSAADLARRFADLGPEPLDDGFDGPCLHDAARGRKRPIKNLLMDQAVVVGVGNIYANEALYRSRVHPHRAAGRLSAASCARIVAAVKAVLRAAIIEGGTTISDFRSVDGREGRFSIQLAVYGRTGEPCCRCGAGSRIRRTVLAGRSTFHCPNCQH